MKNKIKSLKREHPKPNSWSSIKRLNKWKDLLSEISQYITKNSNFENINDLKVSEMFYIIENDIQTKPLCKICSGDVKFFYNPESSNKTGYRQTCSISCSNKYDRHNKIQNKMDNYVVNFKEYKSDFLSYSKMVRKLSDHTYRKFSNDINPNNFPRNRDYHLDHKFSIKEGFENNVPIHIISGKKNLEMILAITNMKKHHHSSISLDEIC